MRRVWGEAEGVIVVGVWGESEKAVGGHSGTVVAHLHLRSVFFVTVTKLDHIVQPTNVMTGGRRAKIQLNWIPMLTKVKVTRYFEW